MRGLSVDGIVDVCLITDDSNRELNPPGYLDVRRASAVARSEQKTISGGRKLFSRGRRGGGSATIAELAKSAGGKYDLIWAAGTEAFEIAKTAKAPIICDMSSQAVRDGASSERQVPDDLGQRCAAIVASSQAELGRLAGLDVSMVPYCFPRPGYPLGERHARQPPVVGMIGGLAGDRGVEAATFFIGEVVPLVVAEMPEATFRLVGAFDDRVAELAAGQQNVTLTGWVDDARAELAKIDVIVNTRRSGWGNPTRILEAFANRIPVVATTTATAELDIEPGVHALIADDAPTFASGCLKAIADHRLRSALAVEADRLFAENHTAEAAGTTIKKLVATKIFGR